MSYAQPRQPSRRWQQWVDQHPIGAIFVVGIMATQLGTYFGYVFPAIGLPVLPWPLFNGILGTTIADGFNGAVADPNFAVSGESFFVGHILHFVNGVIFAVLWAVMFREDVAKWVPNNVMRGLLYGVIMTIISAGLLVPYAYVPNQGFGFFLFDGPDGWKLPFGILLWHLIYGLFLGLLYNPSDDAVDAATA